MTEVLQPVILPEVANAVNFLNDVSQKGYKEGDLKKYLMNSRGLDLEQVEKAFEIHRSRFQKKPDPSESRRSSMTMDRKEEEGQKERINPESILEPNSQERPEMASRSPKNKSGEISPHSSIFLPENQAGGEKLLKDFLRKERSYCNKLQCLKEYYYKELSHKAQENRFQMSKKEVDEIFYRVPQLYEFHRAFYNDMSCEFNIGRIFVRLFDFFKRYVAYMKDCTAAITKMREYTMDQDLHDCLEHIRERTIFKREDVMDLLLVPLKRISEYAEFLEKLLKFADASMEAEYEYLGKASRRIGRVAAYIEKYKDGIWNRNEMNKIQQFLGSQCNIISPYRRIVRRGMMIRRTSGWTARNKHYIFFLFNDVFLWTTIRGNLQNLVHLQNCEVLPSDAKFDSQRKFRIISRGQRYKSLLLECETVKQRDEWYVAVESKISAAKSSSEDLPKRQISSSIVVEKSEDEEDEKNNSSSKVNCLSQKNSTSESNSARWKSNNTDVSTYAETKDGESPLQPLSSYNRRYQLSHNFKEQELSNLDPMDDSVSVVSEQDTSFSEYSKYEEMKSTTTLMSPFTKQQQKSPGPFREPIVPSDSISGKIRSTRSAELKCAKYSGKSSDNELNSPAGKIRREKSPLTVDNELERSSIFSIRLSLLAKS